MPKLKKRKYRNLSNAEALGLLQKHQTEVNSQLQRMAQAKADQTNDDDLFKSLKEGQSPPFPGHIKSFDDLVLHQQQMSGAPASTIKPFASLSTEEYPAVTAFVLENKVDLVDGLAEKLEDPGKSQSLPQKVQKKARNFSRRIRNFVSRESPKAEAAPASSEDYKDITLTAAEFIRFRRVVEQKGSDKARSFASSVGTDIWDGHQKEVDRIKKQARERVKAAEQNRLSQLTQGISAITKPDSLTGEQLSHVTGLLDQIDPTAAELIELEKQKLPESLGIFRDSMAQINFATSAQDEPGFYEEFADGVARKTDLDAALGTIAATATAEDKQAIQDFKDALGKYKKAKEAKTKYDADVYALKNKGDDGAAPPAGSSRLEEQLSQDLWGVYQGRKTEAEGNPAKKPDFDEVKKVWDERVKTQVGEDPSKDLEDASKKLYEAAEALPVAAREHLKDVPGADTLGVKEQGVKGCRDQFKKKMDGLRKALPSKCLFKPDRELLAAYRTRLSELESVKDDELSDPDKLQELLTEIEDLEVNLKGISQRNTVIKDSKEQKTLGAYLGTDGKLHLREDGGKFFFVNENANKLDKVGGLLEQAFLLLTPVGIVDLLEHIFRGADKALSRKNARDDALKQMEEGSLRKDFFEPKTGSDGQMRDKLIRITKANGEHFIRAVTTKELEALQKARLTKRFSGERSFSDELVRKVISNADDTVLNVKDDSYGSSYRPWKDQESEKAFLDQYRVQFAQSYSKRRGYETEIVWMDGMKLARTEGKAQSSIGFKQPAVATPSPSAPQPSAQPALEVPQAPTPAPGGNGATTPIAKTAQEAPTPAGTSVIGSTGLSQHPTAPGK